MSSWKAGILASKWMAATVYSKITFTIPYLLLDPLYSKCKEQFFKIFPEHLYYGPKLLSDLADSNHAWRFLHLFTDEELREKMEENTSVPSLKYGSMLYFWAQLSDCSP